MFTRILLPVDGSELAERPLAYVARLAPVTGAAVHLVAVVDALPDPRWTLAPVIVPEGVYTEAKDRAAAYLEATRTRLLSSGVRDVQTAVLDGDPASRLLDYERDAGIDLVALSTHGRTGLARFALGSVAERLVRYGATPVILVRAFGTVVVPHHVVVPLDGSARAERIVPEVERMAPDLRREVTLLRVARDDADGQEAERYLEGMVGRLRQDGVAAQQRVSVGDPAAAIIEVARDDALVAMTSHGRSPVMRWALGSTAEQVVHGGASAVMLLRQPG